MKRHSLLALGLWAGASSPWGVAAQTPPAPAPDPYTRGEPALQKAAGYVSFGPFPFGDGHDSRAVVESTGEDGWLWVETAHFRIGSTLPEWPLAKADTGRARFREELARLRRRLPRVPASPGTLDPWLRLHLYAQRCEELYQQFQAQLGVTDATFPEGKVPPRPGEDSMGEGPYLGQRGKYAVLLCGRNDQLARYVTRWIGGSRRSAVRHHHRVTGTIVLVTSCDLDNGLLQNDVALHCHVVYHLVHNLVDGYKSQRHDLPVWFKMGLAQRYARAVAPHYQVYDYIQDPDAVAPGEWDWRPKVLGLAKTGAFTPATVLLRQLDYDGLRFADYMTAWSRVDWLLTTREQGVRIFLDVMKAPFHEGRKWPTEADLVQRQEEALRRAWAVDVATFDERWREWVRKHYAKG